MRLTLWNSKDLQKNQNHLLSITFVSWWNLCLSSSLTSPRFGGRKSKCDFKKCIFTDILSLISWCAFMLSKALCNCVLWLTTCMNPSHATHSVDLSFLFNSSLNIRSWIFRTSNNTFLNFGLTFLETKLISLNVVNNICYSTGERVWVAKCASCWPLTFKNCQIYSAAY